MWWNWKCVCNNYVQDWNEILYRNSKCRMHTFHLWFHQCVKSKKVSNTCHMSTFFICTEPFWRNNTIGAIECVKTIVAFKKKYSVPTWIFSQNTIWRKKIFIVRFHFCLFGRVFFRCCCWLKQNFKFSDDMIYFLYLQLWIYIGSHVVRMPFSYFFPFTIPNSYIFLCVNLRLTVNLWL